MVNTHKGLFCYNRLPFGVSAAPAIFQRTIKGIPRGIPKVCVYLDDILVTCNTAEHHLRNLDAIFTWLEESDMQLKWMKCVFMRTWLDTISLLKATDYHMCSGGQDTWDGILAPMRYETSIQRGMKSLRNIFILYLCKQALLTVIMEGPSGKGGTHTYLDFWERALSIRISQTGRDNWTWYCRIINYRLPVLCTVIITPNLSYLDRILW